MYTFAGKFLGLVKTENAEKFSQVQLDIMWYLMHLTKISRLISRESIQDFLTRYFLITGVNIDQTALDFINNGKLIEGTIETKVFSLSVKDMMALNGFASNESRYNIHGTLDDFIKEYKYRAPNIKLSQKEGQKEITISTDALAFGLMGLTTLLEVDSLSLQFKDDLMEVTEDEKQKAIAFSAYVVSHMDDAFFEAYEKDFPGVRAQFEERFYPGKIIRFDVYKDLSRENLIKIYEFIITKEEIETFKELDVSDEDFVADLGIPNEHIVFAYGVKHGYIDLTYDLMSMHYDYSSYFDIDADLLKGPDDECYPSKDIYEMWNMEEWIHLLP